MSYTPHLKVFRGVSIIFSLLLITIFTLSHAQLRGYPDYYSPNLIQQPLQSHHPSFRYLTQFGYTGSTTHTRHDNSILLLLNSTSDLQQFTDMIETIKLSERSKLSKIDAQFIPFALIIPPHLLSTDYLIKLNQTTSPSKQHSTDLLVNAIFTFILPSEQRSPQPSPTSRPPAFNLDSPTPQSDIAPTNAHARFPWNSAGSDILHRSLFYQVVVLTAPYEIATIITKGGSNWATFLSRNHHLISASASFTAPDAKATSIDTHSLLHAVSMSYYNSGHLNSTQCLHDCTCAPLGGHSVISTISQPNWIPHQPWILIPIPFNSRSLIYDMTPSMQHTQSSLIVTMAIVKAMTQYYNATITNTTAIPDQLLSFFQQPAPQFATTPITDDPTPPPKRRHKFVFALIASDDYSGVGSRAFLHDLWQSLEFRTNDDTAIHFDEFTEDNPMPPDIHVNAQFYPCKDPQPGFSRPPFAPLLNTTQTLCYDPFRTQSAYFQGLDLRDLEAIIQFENIAASTLYVHKEHNGNTPEMNAELDDWIKMYQDIAAKVPILEKTNHLTIQKANQLVTPGIPPSSLSVFSANLTYTPLTPHNLTKIPKMLFISDYDSDQSTTNPYKFSPFDDVSRLGGDVGYNVFCGQATALLRFLLTISNGYKIPPSFQDRAGQGISAPPLLDILDEVNINCELLQSLLHCFISDRRCSLFSALSRHFYDNTNKNDSGGDTSDKSGDDTSSPSTIRDALVYSAQSSVYTPKYVPDIDGMSNFLSSWFYLAGYYTAWNSNKVEIPDTNNETNTPRSTLTPTPTSTSTSPTIAQLSTQPSSPTQPVPLSDFTRQDQATIDFNQHLLRIRGQLDAVKPSRPQSQLINPPPQHIPQLRLFAPLAVLFHQYQPIMNSYLNAFTNFVFGSEESAIDAMVQGQAQTQHSKHGTEIRADHIGRIQPLETDPDETPEEHNIKLRRLLAYSSFAYFHDAKDPSISINTTTDRFDIDHGFYSAAPNPYTGRVYQPLLWTESNWDSTTFTKSYTRVLMQDEIIILCVGATILLLSTLFGVYLKAYLDHSLYHVGIPKDLERRLNKQIHSRNAQLAHSR